MPNCYSCQNRHLRRYSRIKLYTPIMFHFIQISIKHFHTDFHKGDKDISSMLNLATLLNLSERSRWGRGGMLSLAERIRKSYISERWRKSNRGGLWAGSKNLTRLNEKNHTSQSIDSNSRSSFTGRLFGMSL